MAGGRVYLTASEGDRLLTICIDAASGRQLWRREIRRTRAHKVYSANDPASPTATADETGVVVFFADVGLAAYSRDGKALWTLPLGPFKSFYGMAASPILAGDLAVLLCDQRSGSFVVAVDRTSGRIRWKRPRPEAVEGWATPVVFRATGAAGTQLVVLGSNRLDAYELDTGEPRWWMPLGSNGAMGTIVTSGDTLFLSTAGSINPALPPFGGYLEKYDTNKDRRLSSAEFKADKEMGEHFGWIDADDDGIITEAEWTRTANLARGESGAIALRPASARGRLDPASVLWRFQKNLPYMPAPLFYKDGAVPSEDRRDHHVAGSGNRPAFEGGTQHRGPWRLLCVTRCCRRQDLSRQCRRQDHGPQGRAAMGGVGCQRPRRGDPFDPRVERRTDLRSDSECAVLVSPQRRLGLRDHLPERGR